MLGVGVTHVADALGQRMGGEDHGVTALVPTNLVAGRPDVDERVADPIGQQGHQVRFGVPGGHGTKGHGPRQCGLRPRDVLP